MDGSATTKIASDDIPLCGRCKTLHLSTDKFIVRDFPTSLVQHGRTAETSRSKSGSRIEDFARLDQLSATRDACNFCHLLWAAMQRHSHQNSCDSTACSLTWEVDGRRGMEGQGNHVNSTRRIRVSWRETTGRTQEVHVVFVAPSDPERPNSDAFSHCSESTHFLGREFGEQREKHALIRSWVDICHLDHDACLDIHHTDEEFRDLVNETYFGVIDVVDMQLKSLPMNEQNWPTRYVALSYVWGRLPHDEPPYRTTRANVMTHILHGGLEAAWDKLPRTLQDAILLVSRLGERYIWIDSLCIVQDSHNSWQLNSKAMHLVYGNAYFTICAADGDAMTGLSAVNVNASNSALEGPAEASPSIQMSFECAPGVRLMTTRPLEAVISDSAWNKRAWTFQERILSRRCVVFAEGRVYFQCRTTGFSQNIHAGAKGSSWSLDQTNSPHRTLNDLKQRPLWFYMKYVSMYTDRSLTKPQDILAAFEGIAWLLESCVKAKFLFGMPTSHFDLCLLWMPQGALCRRRPPRQHADSRVRACTQDAMGNCTCHEEAASFEGDGFPSWAWSGWMGGAAGYDPGMIDGCLLNVRQWLKYHTWIHWHIRDARGHLRPLPGFWFPEFEEMRTTPGQHTKAWSASGSFEDDHRWGGYPCRSRGGENSLTPTSRAELPVDSSPAMLGTDSGILRASNSAYRNREAPSYAWDDKVVQRRGTGEPTPSRVASGTEGHSSAPSDDTYGRPIRSDMFDAENRFQSILPDSPFGVIRDNSPVDPSEAMCTPILQFFTWAVDLYVSVREPANPGAGTNRPVAPVCYCDIIDQEGDWCGSIMLPELWIRQREGCRLRFIAISNAKSFTLQECPVWTYYIPKERDESEWDLYFTLLLDRDEERGVWERVGLGKVFQAAFREKSWDEIKLG